MTRTLKELLPEIAEALREAPEPTVLLALPRIARELGVMRISYDSLKWALREANYPSAAELMRSAHTVARATPTAANDVTPRRDTLERHLSAERERLLSYNHGMTRVLVCPDVHVPYHDPLAWETFLSAAQAIRPDVLVIIGDFADCYAVSAHAKDPARKLSAMDEIEATNRELTRLERLGIPRVIYCEGNHEYRIPRYIASQAREFYGMLSVRSLLQIDARGWEWVPYKSWITIGKFAFTHDVERSGINAARQSLQDFGGNLVFGHTHRGGVVYQGTVEGSQHVCLNVGWLGDYDAIDYKHKARALRDWQHGFGYLEIEDSTGVGWAQFVPILGGRARVCGVAVSGRAAA